MAMAVYSTQIGKRRAQIISLVLTLVLGLAFLGIKAVEYNAKYDDHLIPGSLIPGNPFNPDPHAAASAAGCFDADTSRCSTGSISR